MDTWEFIVVGGGHNGLVAAATLAEAGQRVLVLEQLPILGGMATSHPWVDAAPHHILSRGAMDNVFMASTSLEQDLGLARYGYRATRVDHPYGWLGADGETLLLFGDRQRTIEEISHFSPADARAYRDLLGAMDWLLDTQALITSRQPDDLPKRALLRQLLKLAPDRSSRRLVARMLSTSLIEMAGETFTSDPMRALCTYWGTMIGPVDQDAGGFLCVGLGAVHRQPGVMRPIGGMGGLIRALAAHIQAHRGEIRTGAPVERVLVSGNRARGVRLSSGDELTTSRGVLLCCAPQIGLGELLDDGVLDDATRAAIRTLPANGNDSAPLKIDLAIGSRLTLPNAEAARRRRDGTDIRTTALMTGTFSDQVDQLSAIQQGHSQPVPPVYMAILSASDPSIAPDGADVFYLHANMPFVLEGGWNGPAGQSCIDATLTAARQHIDGLDAEIGRVVTTPHDLQNTFKAPRACMFHVDMMPLRLAMRRPARGLGGHRTPLEGLFLAASGTHPGGGVNGWPGRLGAQTALAAAPHAQ